MQKGHKKVHEQQTIPPFVQTVHNKNTPKNNSPARTHARRPIETASQQRNTSNTNKIKKLKIKNSYQHHEKLSTNISQFEFQNEKMREKLQSPEICRISTKDGKMKLQSSQKLQEDEEYSPYAQIQKNDYRYFAQYLESTQRYSAGGINLKWPYYFGTQ